MSVIAIEIPGARVVDLFAGSGALGLETLSRGAEHVTFVENAQSALWPLRENIKQLGADDRVKIERADAVRFADGLKEGAFDLALADPPYGQGYAERLARIFVATPFARLLCVEHGRHDPVPEAVDMWSRDYGDTRLTFIPSSR